MLHFGASFWCFFWTYQSLVFYSVLLYNSSQSFYFFQKCGRAQIKMGKAERVGGALVKRPKGQVSKSLSELPQKKIVIQQPDWSDLQSSEKQPLSWRSGAKYVFTSACVKMEKQRCSADCENDGNTASWWHSTSVLMVKSHLHVFGKKMVISCMKHRFRHQNRFKSTELWKIQAVPLHTYLLVPQSSWFLIVFASHTQNKR